MRRAKILATLGPASANEGTLDALLAAGVDGFRLNFSHGTHEQHRTNYALVRAASKRAGRPVAVLGDLAGPKIRIGTFAKGPITLVPGEPFALTSEAVEGDASRVSMTYPLGNDLLAGDLLLLDDGLLSLRVESVDGATVRTRVVVGGPLSDRKGINVPGRALRISAVTEKDLRDAALARELGVDYLALSFVRSAADLKECRLVSGPVPLIAKLEKPEAVERLEEIIAASDGIMVARGDMGVELGSEKVPIIQKRTIRAVNSAGKLVITATQMLDSMIRNPRPTRAEATDVANAVLDGTDVLMLSGETAAGAYPVESVKTMASIIEEVERSELYKELPAPGAFGNAWALANACARAAANTSRFVPLAGIVVATREGYSADVLADYRPNAPILAISGDAGAAQRLALQWGVRPLHKELPMQLELAVRECEAAAREHLGAASGQPIAVLLGRAFSAGAHTLMLRTLG